MLTVKGKTQDYSVPFHLLFPCLQLFRPCSDSCLGGVSKKHDSDGLTTEKQRRLCMIGWLQCSALFFHPQCVPQCPTIMSQSHNVPQCHPHAMTPSHLCTHYSMASPPLPYTNRQRQRQRSEQRKRQKIFCADIENLKRRKLT